MHTPRPMEVPDGGSSDALGPEPVEVALLTCDGHRRVVAANDAAERLLQRTKAELLGHPLESLSPASARARTAAELAVLLGERAGTWGTIVVADGELGGRLRLEARCRHESASEGFSVTLRRPTRPAAAGPVLNDRERAVFARVADGKTGTEVAQELFLSQATVERHVSAGLRKLGAKNRAHGIAIALRTGELERPSPERSGEEPAGERAVDALLAQTLEGLEDAAAILDAQGDVLLANEAWDVLGRENRRTGVQPGQNYLAACDAATDDDGARRTGWGIRELLDDRAQDFTMEYRRGTPDRLRWFEMRATRYHGGAAGAAVLVRHRDVTVQRRAEHDARIGRIVLDGVDTATVVFTPEGVVTAWMPGAEAMAGWTEREALGRPIWDLVLPRSDVPRGEAVVEETRRNGRWSGELQLERADGTPFQAEVRVRALVDAAGEVAGIIAVAIDRSEQRRAERAAAEAAVQLQAFADTSRDGWISGDASGRITQVNVATEELLGWTADELVGRPVDAIMAAPTPLRRLGRPAGGGGPRQVLEECLVTADGREVPVEYTTTRFCTGERLNQWAIVFRVVGEE